MDKSEVVDTDNPDNQGNRDNHDGWSTKINKRPDKGRNSFSRRHSHDNQPNEFTGIRKPRSIPTPVINFIDRPEGNVAFKSTTDISGYNKTGIQWYRRVTPSKVGRWIQQPIKPLDIRRLSQSRSTHHLPIGSRQGGRRRTHKHKRKNKHTRRRVQRRRA